MCDSPRFTWMESYQAIADALLARKNRRDGIEELYVKITGDEGRAMIDPFTFFTAFNRGMVDIDRKNMVHEIVEAFELDVPEPQDFLGIPTANHELWQYFDDTEESAEDCWNLFEVALTVADAEQPTTEQILEFCEMFDRVHDGENVTKARLTRTLYWMRPSFYLPIGEKARDYVHSRYGLDVPVRMRGARYLRLLQEIRAVADDREFFEIAERSYRAADEDWWPDPADYDPDMSIHQWMVLLQDDELTSSEVLEAVRKMIEMGGDATTTELANERGEHDKDYYSTLLRGYARDTARKMGRSAYKGSWWPFIFTGQNADSTRRGDYIWRLRPEVVEAFKEID